MATAKKKSGRSKSKPATTGAKKKPAAKKVPTASKVASASSAPRAARKKSPVAQKASATTPSAEERYLMIQQEAYYQAEADGFRHDPTAYWVRAEAQINSRIGQ